MIIETVFALLLIVDHKIIEHRIQPSLSQCLKGKREAHLCPFAAAARMSSSMSSSHHCAIARTLHPLQGHALSPFVVKTAVSK